MTTAHRPTFDPARGKDAQRGPAYHQRLLPAHTYLKTRQPGQGGDAAPQVRDLRAQLLEAETAHYSKKGGPAPSSSKLRSIDTHVGPKRQLEAAPGLEDDQDESLDSKRRRVLEDTRDIDADSDESESESIETERFSSSSETIYDGGLTYDSDEEDETAELLRELEKIKRERAEQREREEAEKEAGEREKREHDIALGNPLLNPTKDFNVRRRWDDDVVFKNQARGTEDKRKKEFVNDLLRSDFHKRFMSKYVR